MTKDTNGCLITFILSPTYEVTKDTDGYLVTHLYSKSYLRGR